MKKIMLFKNYRKNRRLAQYYFKMKQMQKK